MNEIEPEQASQENTTDTGKAGKKKRTKTTWSPFERVTALRGQSFSRPQGPKNIRRSLTSLDIDGKDAGIPHVKFDAIARDLIGSLIERQDRMNEEIFAMLNDLADRLEDLEQDRQEDPCAK